MKKLLLFLLVLCIGTSQANNDVIYETGISNDKSTFQGSGFLKVKTIAFLTEEQLKPWVQDNFALKDVIYLKPKDYTTYFGADPSQDEEPTFKNKLELLFNYENNQTIFIGTYFNDMPDRWRVSTQVDLLNKKDKDWVAHSQGYILKDINKSKLIKMQTFNNSSFTLISTKSDAYFHAGFFAEPIKVIYITKIKNKTYVYGVEFQIHNEPHSSKRFTKLDKKGNTLAVNASSWACIHDKETGLVWENNIDYKEEKYAWGKWTELLKNVNQDLLCGFSDWRVPNNGEVYSITDYGQLYTSDKSRRPFKSNFFTYPYKVWTVYKYTKRKNSAYSVMFSLSPKTYRTKPGRLNSVILVRGHKEIPPIFYYGDKGISSEILE